MRKGEEDCYVVMEYIIGYYTGYEVYTHHALICICIDVLRIVIFLSWLPCKCSLTFCSLADVVPSSLLPRFMDEVDANCNLPTAARSL